LTAHKNQPFAMRLRFALAGLAHALRSEQSVKAQVVVFVLVIAAMLWLSPGVYWWALVILASAGVFATELLNTAIEHLADHLHPEVHPQIRVVKDCAAAAVLIAVLGAMGVGVALAIRMIQIGLTLHLVVD
jgi:undecaprenol kinase